MTIFVPDTAPASDEQAAWAAAGWRALADAEEARPTWDREACPINVASRAAAYREAAASIEAGRARARSAGRTDG